MMLWGRSAARRPVHQRPSDRRDRGQENKIAPHFVQRWLASLVKVPSSLLAEIMAGRLYDAVRYVVAGCLALWASLPVAGYAGEPLKLLICHPGGPDLAPEQQKAIEKMYRYLEKKTGLASGKIQGSYQNEHEACVAGLKEKPAIVMPSLPIYLEYKDKFGLIPVAQLRLNGKVEDQFYILVKADSPLDSVASLAGKTITGTHVSSVGFVVGVVLEGQLKRAQVNLEPKRFGLRAIRAVTRGKADAVLLDGTQFRALAGTRFEKKLRVLHASKALPTPPVTVVSKCTPDDFGGRLGRAMAGMTRDQEGQAVVRLFRMEGFELAAPQTWASLEKRIKSAP